MNHDEFVCLTPDVWVIDARLVRKDRIRRLVQPPPFPEILRLLIGSARVHSVRTEAMQCHTGLTRQPRRAVVRYDVSSHSLDLFFNSAAGVRAQCLYSVELGKQALDLARDGLRELALDAVCHWSSKHMQAMEAYKSVTDPTSKLWVRQGLWVRTAKADERPLCIAKWQSELQHATLKERQLIRYGSKIPTLPAQLEYIGAWIAARRTTAGKALERRPLQIHRLGFT